MASDSVAVERVRRCFLARTAPPLRARGSELGGSFTTRTASGLAGWHQSFSRIGWRRHALFASCVVCLPASVNAQELAYVANLRASTVSVIEGQAVTGRIAVGADPDGLAVGPGFFHRSRGSPRA